MCDLSVLFLAQFLLKFAHIMVLLHMLYVIVINYTAQGVRSRGNTGEADYFIGLPHPRILQSNVSSKVNLLNDDILTDWNLQS